MCDGDDSELEDRPTVPSTPVPKRRWVPASELAELRQLPGDPDFLRDLEKMGGEMIDPWA
jgi:hypothetical protein